MKGNKRYFFLAIVILIVVAVGYYIGSGRLRVYINNKELRKSVTSIADDTVCLNDIVPFEWDTVYTFSPYGDKESIEETIGFKSSLIKVNNINEGLVHLIFVKDNKVMASVLGYSSNLGYRIDFNDRINYSDKAVFNVSKTNDQTILKLKTEEKGLVFNGTIEEIYESSVMVSTNDDVGFDEAHVDLSNCDYNFNLVKGQNVMITLGSEIMETHPVQADALKIKLIRNENADNQNDDNQKIDNNDKGASFNMENVKVNYNRVIWNRDGENIMWSVADNEKSSKSITKNIPIVRIDSKEELDSFSNKTEGRFPVNISADDFNENALFIAYVSESSGSVRHKITDISVSNGQLKVIMERRAPEIGTSDMAAWLITFEINKNELKGVSSLDAYFSTGKNIRIK